ncbi:uncharacterized protein RCH25_041440 [Pelodytes ibericus]
MAVESVVHSLSGPVALHLLLLLVTSTQCSSLPLREVHAIPGESLNVTCHFSRDQYKNLAVIFCRQVSETECIDIMSLRRLNRNMHQKRLTSTQSSQETGENIFLSVTMMELQHSDTGLYKWQVWTNQQYKVFENVLIHVMEVSPPNLQVIEAKYEETVEMLCTYNKQQRWSKIWCKHIGPTCEWVAHSNGNINGDYQNRPTVSDNHISLVMKLNLQQLELWDSGLYQCQESGGETILSKILLLVKPEKTNSNDGDYTSKTEPTSTTQPSHMGPNRGTLETRTEQRPHGTWDVLRWVLLFLMVLCFALFSCYERFTVTRVYQTKFH